MRSDVDPAPPPPHPPRPPGFEVPKLNIFGPCLILPYFLASLCLACYFFNLSLFIIIQVHKLSSLTSLGALKVEVLAFGLGFT